MTEHLIQRSYKFRFEPTLEQKRLLNRYFGAARWVWNDRLAMRSKAYSRRCETVTAKSYSRHLTYLKTTSRFKWLSTIPSTVLTQSLRDQDRAFSNFFAGHARYPKSRIQF